MARQVQKSLRDIIQKKANSLYSRHGPPMDLDTVVCKDFPSATDSKLDPIRCQHLLGVILSVSPYLGRAAGAY